MLTKVLPKDLALLMAPPDLGFCRGGALPTPTDQVFSCSHLHPHSSHSNSVLMSSRVSLGIEKFTPSSENSTALLLPIEGTLPLVFLRPDRAPGGLQTCWEASADSFPGTSRAETHSEELSNEQGTSSALVVSVSPLLAGRVRFPVFSF